MSAAPVSLFAKTRAFLSAEGGLYRKLLASSLVGIGSIAVLAACFLIFAVREHRADLRRTKTLEILQAMNKAENGLATVDTSYQASLLTGKTAFTEQLPHHEIAVQKLLSQLRFLLQLDPARANSVDEISRQFSEWTQSISKQDGVSVPAKGAPAAPLLDETRESLRKLRGAEELVMANDTGGDFSGSAAFQVLVFTSRLQSIVSEIENAQFRFLLTGEKGFLERYNRALAEFYACNGHLSILTGRRNGADKPFVRIAETIDRWQRESAIPQITAKRENRDIAGLIERGRGSETMDAARSMITAVERDITGAYEKDRSRSELIELAKTASLAAICAVTIAVLTASSWYNFRAYRRHLGKIDTAEAQTRSIIETTLDGIITFTDQGLIGSVNPAAEKMFGYSTNELIGQAITKLIPQRLFLHETASIGRGTMMTIGHRQNFYPFPIEISLSEMHTRQKQYVALIRDVTERKKAEETLKHIGLGVSASTGEEFVRSLVKELSKALQSEFAFVVETIKKGEENVCTLVIAEHGAIRSKTNYKLANTICEEVLKKGFRAYPKLVRETFPNDDLLAELDAESFLAMPLTDHKGKPVGLMGVIDRKAMENVDIAESTLQIFAARAAAEIERKRFEEDLAAEKERLAVTLRSIGDGFITTDTAGNVLMINNIAEKLTGWDQERALNKPLGEVFRILNEHTRKPHQAAIDRIVETGAVVGSATHSLIVSREGNERLIETSASPIRDRLSRKIGVVLVFRDITERHRLEEERRKAEKLESLGVAAGGIAHDFNNLLTAIIGNLSLSLLDSNDDPKLIERLTTAKKASLRAQELAQQLLTFARGGAPIKKTATIGQLIQDTVKFSLRGSNIRGDFRIPDELWPVDIDQGQISQVIGNLTINAEQAMPGGGTVTVECENFDLASENANLAPLRAGHYIRIAVHDEGIGIPEEYLKKIFDPYFTTKPKGSGLGLATSYSIIKNHDGLITVTSKPGAGAKFEIYLPASEKELAAHKEAQNRAPSQGKGRILVLDDEEVICALVTHALTPLGYEVTEAYDPEVAIQIYETAMQEGDRFDAVISDLTIPGTMGGAEAIKRLRVLDPTVKAIVSSGYANDPVMSRFKEYGFCASIAKPYEISELGHVVFNVLEKSNENLIYHDYAQAQLA